MTHSDKKQSESDLSKMHSSKAALPNKLLKGFDKNLTNDVFIRFDTSKKHLYHSGNLFSMLNTKPDNIIGQAISETDYLGELTNDIDQILDLIVKNDTPYFNEFRLKNTNEPLWISISLSPEKDATGDFVAVNGLIRDITKQKDAESQIQKKEEWEQLVVDASELGIWDWEVNSEDLQISRKWKAQLGYYPDELEDKFQTWMNKLHPDDYNRVERSFSNFLKSSSLIFESEFRLKHRDGVYRWIKTRAAAIRDNQGEVLRILGTNRDITTEKKHEGNLRKLNQAIMQSPVAIVITDLDGYIELFNPAYCKITGFQKDELIGKKTNIQKSGFHSKKFYEELWDTITTGNEWTGEFKNRNKNGRTYWELASISSLKDEHGIITNYIKISEEITSFKRLEEELKKSRKRTRIENQSRHNFMASMSHEIRTPINGIIGFSELLQTGDLSEEQQHRYADIIEKSSRYLLVLIDDIIDISKIEANELKIKKDACSIQNTFSELSARFSEMQEAREKPNLEIRFRKPTLKHHDYIFTDTQRLKQILFNLFDNALKYTESGHIEIGYQLMTNKKIQFYVEDTGKGIPKEQKNTIFDRTLHHAHSLKERKGGAGLGLAISNGLVKLMGGSMNVKSTEGKGSIFYFTIPYDKISAPAKPQPKEQKQDYDFTGFTILIAEDVDYNYEYLAEILRDTNAKVLWAKDGIDALNLYGKNTVDLILMDIQMPEIDGYQATQTIRETDKEIPIIAQTAYAMAEEKQKCLDSGCNDVLSKPIKMKELLDTLASYLK